MRRLVRGPSFCVFRSRIRPLTCLARVRIVFGPGGKDEVRELEEDKCGGIESRGAGTNAYYCNLTPLRRCSFSRLKGPPVSGEARRNADRQGAARPCVIIRWARVLPPRSRR